LKVKIEQSIFVFQIVKFGIDKFRIFENEIARRNYGDALKKF